MQDCIIWQMFNVRTLFKKLFSQTTNGDPITIAQVGLQLHCGLYLLGVVVSFVSVKVFYPKYKQTYKMLWSCSDMTGVLVMRKYKVDTVHMKDKQASWKETAD